MQVSALDERLMTLLRLVLFLSMEWWWIRWEQRFCQRMRYDSMTNLADTAESIAKLRDFLLRIQLRSDAHPNLDGAWMRSFDYEKWEYWGSSADIGWAAWSIESGWTNAWLASMLILQERKESLLQLSSRDAFSAIAPALYEDMMTRRPTQDVLEKPTAKMAGSAE